jgi:hypothetical protein
MRVPEPRTCKLTPQRPLDAWLAVSARFRPPGEELLEDRD